MEIERSWIEEAGRIRKKEDVGRRRKGEEVGRGRRKEEVGRRRMWRKSEEEGRSKKEV